MVGCGTGMGIYGDRFSVEPREQQLIHILPVLDDRTAMNDRTRRLVTYIIKCVTGALIVFTIARLVHYNDLGWSLISTMLVLSPDAKDAVPLAITRIKANVL